MRQRAEFRKLVPETEGHPAQDSQTSGHPFVLLLLLGEEREQDVLHQLDQLGTVPHHLEGVEAVRAFRLVETDIIQLVGIAVLFDQIIGRLCIVRVLEVIDEPGESESDIFLQQPFAYAFCLSGTGAAIYEEVCEMVMEFQVGVRNPRDHRQPDRFSAPSFSCGPGMLPYPQKGCHGQ